MDKTLTIPYDETFHLAQNKLEWIQQRQVRYMWQGSQALITRKTKLFREPVHQDSMEEYIGQHLPGLVTNMMFAIQDRYISPWSGKARWVKFMIVVEPVSTSSGWRLVATAHAYRDVKYTDGSKAVRDK